MALDEEHIQRDRTFRLSNGGQFVDVTRIYTPKGTRLEIEDPEGGHRIRLDAMALESISWQEKDTFPLEGDAGESRPSIAEAGTGEVTRGDRIQVTNEFAQVNVRRVTTEAIEGLEIESPKLGYRIRLDVVDLLSVSKQPMNRFSEFLENPYGPDPD